MLFRLDLYDEETRGKTEALQWKLGQELLGLGLTVIIEWGTWGRSERDALRLGARALGAAVELHLIVKWNRSGKVFWWPSVWSERVLLYCTGPSRNEGLRRRRRSV